MLQKASVLTYSPCSAGAGETSQHEGFVCLQQRKILTPDPKRRVNIHCLEVSTDPTPGPCRHLCLILQRAAQLAPDTQEAQELPPPPCHPRDTTLLPPIPASSNPKVTHPSPAQDNQQPATNFTPIKFPDSTVLNPAAPRRGFVLQKINFGEVYPSQRLERSLCKPTPCRPECGGRELHHPQRLSGFAAVLVSPTNTPGESSKSQGQP